MRWLLVLFPALWRKCEARLSLPLPSVGDLRDQLLLKSSGVNLRSASQPSDEQDCDGGTCRLRTRRVGLDAFCSELQALRQESGSEFVAAGDLLMRYCKNAAVSDEPKYRKIRLANKAFRKALAPFPAGTACLRAVGFDIVGGSTPEDAALLLGSGTDSQLLLAAAANVERELLWLRLRDGWCVCMHGFFVGLTAASQPRLCDTALE